MAITKFEVRFPVKDEFNQNELSSNKSLSDIPYLNLEDKIAHLNIQFLLLFSCKAFQEFFIENSDKSNVLSSKILNTFVESLNKYASKSTALPLNEIGFDNLLQELLCTNFFRIISHHLLCDEFPEMNTIENPESIIGIISGFALANKDLVRVNLSNLIGKVSSKLIEGFFGIITTNPSLEKGINILCKNAKIKGDLTLNLLKMISNYKNEGVYTSCLEICK